MTLRPHIAAPLADLPGIAHGYFGRQGGVSGGIYRALNCGLGSRDDRAAVVENRARCRAALPGAAHLVTVHQTHSADAVAVEAPWPAEAAPRADALVTRQPGIALAVLTADCAPILLADAEAGVIGAAHAGWKGALGGIVEATVAAMAALGAERSRIRAAIGPCIGPSSYEVGAEFHDRFRTEDAESDAFFAPAPAPDKALFDLAGYAALRLARSGVETVVATGHDTLPAEAAFFSHRRAVQRGEPDYGRQMSCILLTG